MTRVSSVDYIHNSLLLSGKKEPDYNMKLSVSDIITDTDNSMNTPNINTNSIDLSFTLNNINYYIKDDISFNIRFHTIDGNNITSGLIDDYIDTKYIVNDNIILYDNGLLFDFSNSIINFVNIENDNYCQITTKLVAGETISGKKVYLTNEVDIDFDSVSIGSSSIVTLDNEIGNNEIYWTTYNDAAKDFKITFNIEDSEKLVNFNDNKIYFDYESEQNVCIRIDIDGASNHIDGASNNMYINDNFHTYLDNLNTDLSFIWTIENSDISMSRIRIKYENNKSYKQFLNYIDNSFQYVNDKNDFSLNITSEGFYEIDENTATLYNNGLDFELDIKNIDIVDISDNSYYQITTKLIAGKTNADKNIYLTYYYKSFDPFYFARDATVNTAPLAPQHAGDASYSKIVQNTQYVEVSMRFIKMFKPWWLAMTQLDRPGANYEQVGGADDDDGRYKKRGLHAYTHSFNVKNKYGDNTSGDTRWKIHYHDASGYTFWNNVGDASEFEPKPTGLHEVLISPELPPYHPAGLHTRTGPYAPTSDASNIYFDISMVTNSTTGEKNFVIKSKELISYPYLYLHPIWSLRYDGGDVAGQAEIQPVHFDASLIPNTYVRFGPTPIDSTNKLYPFHIPIIWTTDENKASDFKIIYDNSYTNNNNSIIANTINKYLLTQIAFSGSNARYSIVKNRDNVNDNSSNIIIDLCCNFANCNITDLCFEIHYDYDNPYEINLIDNSNSELLSQSNNVILGSKIIKYVINHRKILKDISDSELSYIIRHKERDISAGPYNITVDISCDNISLTDILNTIYHVIDQPETGDIIYDINNDNTCNINDILSLIYKFIDNS